MFELYELTTESDGVKEWTFFVVYQGTVPQPCQRPVSSGIWVLGKSDEEERKRYEEGCQAARWEVARLNRNGKPPGQR